LIIILQENCLKKNGDSGIKIKDLGVRNLQIIGNELIKNEYGGIIISQVH
jgi:hypothetical protein